MNKNFILLSAGIVLLITATVLNSNSFIFDERLFPPNIELMEKDGFGEKFLIEMKDQAPGPLYEFVHLPLKPFTKLIPVRMRIVNMSLFLLVIAVLYAYYRNIAGKDKKQALFASLHLIAVPTLWQVTGLALTEIPAMLFATLWFYSFSILVRPSTQKSERKTILLSMLTGLLLGLSILGRTPYLFLVLSGIFVVLFDRYFLKEEIKPASTVIPQTVLSLCMILPVFVIWHGMVPPLQVSVEGPLKPWHCILAIAYAGITGLIINPKWFIIPQLSIKRLSVILGSVFILFLIANSLFLGYSYAPLSVTVSRLAGPALFHVYELITAGLLATIAAYFLMCCYYQGWENRYNLPFLLALISMLAILATATKISHQFSSRYVAQAAPFMVVIFTHVDQKDSWKWIRIIIGMIIGFLSLNTYAQIL